ncbi:hypothetical protein PHMEG_00016671 [Phytophthora megakarya]|uniref:Uncharacterized protein n=1 Tax=Phytophthora megakarya TaxID=4795 RepID=A0A225VZX8_9STRA|nr:hypothetical protein PHMEG_00016671 [Phytophthora megakarya]
MNKNMSCRTFTGAQRNWSVIEKEAYPIVSACDNSHRGSKECVGGHDNALGWMSTPKQSFHNETKGKARAGWRRRV